MRTEFRLLGPLEVVEDGRPLPLGSPQARTLLALLLLRRNQVVSRERIIDELWDVSPPRSAANVVQKHVSRLRKLLNERVVTQHSGYLLRVEAREVDVDRFAALVREARAASETAQAVQLLDEALALWRDEPLSDLVLGAEAARDALALEEQRAAALEERIELHLEQGRHRELVAELRELVGRYPLRERLRRQLMLALYRSERQAEALAAYRDARRELVEALGIEPSAMLRELERRILAQDQTLVVAPPARPATAQDERRTVCVVVIELDSGDLDVEDAEELVGPWTEGVIEEVSRFGGTVERRVGHTIYALFGTERVHEDDAERAVRAALACRYRFNLRAGIAFGDVLLRGREIRGDVASTAARLASTAARHAIVATDRVRRATAHAVEFRAFGDAWEVLAARPGPGTDLLRSGRAQLVGRTRELDALERAVIRARDAPQVVTLIGAPGIGKSRLVRELKHTHDTVAWLEGRSISYGDGPPFWPLAQIVKARAGILDSDGPARASDRLRATVRSVGAPNPEWTAEQLERLIAAAPRMRSEPGRDAAFAAWLGFLEALARETPLVVVFEDLHWADDGTLDFLAHLGASIVDAPLLVLCTARPELLQRRPAWGGGVRDATSIALEPLSEPEVTDLLPTLLDGPATDALTRWLLDRVDGNPLFAEEFVRVLVDGAMVERDERGTWRLRDDSGVEVLPDSVHGIIAARIDALPPQQRALLRDASVVGKVFWAETLGRDTRELLRALARRDFIAREPRSVFEGKQQYAFKHALICDVAYRQIPRGDRAAKHRRAAEWLEGHAPGEDAAELIAHHRWSAFELSRRDPALVPRTLASLVRAGERARRLYANEDAASYLRRALELAEDADLEESLGDVLALGDEHAGREAYERALALTSPLARLQRGRLHRKRGAALSRQRRVDDALAAFAEAEAAFGASPAWEERLELEFDRLELLYFNADLAAFADAIERAKPLIARYGTPLQNARLLHHLAMEQLRRDRYVVEPVTIERIKQGLATVEALGSLPTICSWRFTVGFVLLWAREFGEAQERLSASLELASAIGDAARRVRSLIYLALLHRLRGDVRLTAEFAQAGLVAASDAGMRAYVAQAHAHLGWVALAGRRRDDARKQLDRAREMWGSGGPETAMAWMLWWPCLAIATDDEEALDCARRLLAPGVQPPPAPLRDRLAQAVAVADRGATASASFAEAVTLAREHGLL